MNAWTIYWILKLDDIQLLFAILGSCGVAIVVFLLMPILMESNWERWRKDWMTAIIIFSFIILLAVLMPSTKQLATIIVAPKIINNEQIQQMPEKLLELGNKQVDKWIKDLEK